MMTALSYPLLDAFLTILWFFLFVLWIWLVIWVIIDIFASDDLSGFAMAVWLVLVLLFPLIGVVLYLLSRGHQMAQRRSRSRPG